MSKDSSGEDLNTVDSEMDPEGSVSLEFFSKSSGSDLFTVEISQGEFDRYQLLANNMGEKVEHLIFDAIQSHVIDQNNVWLTPQQADEGENILLDTNNPVVIPKNLNVSGATDGND